MSSEIIKVPDIGSDEAVEIIEVSVKEGDEVSAEDTLITLESDKASMDIPAPKGGKVKRLLVAEGDKVSTGDSIVELETDASESSEQRDESTTAASEASSREEPTQAETSATTQPTSKSASTSSEIDIVVPDIGDEAAEVIEVAVSAGADIDAEDTLITLESDKASMDIPSPVQGHITAITVKEGDKVSTGDVIGRMKVAGDETSSAVDSQPAGESPSSSSETAAGAVSEAPTTSAQASSSGKASGTETRELRVPDIGSDDAVPVIEVAVSEGDSLEEEATLLTLESDKASMDIPSPYAGKVVSVAVKEGDSLKQGDLIGTIEVTTSAPAESKAQPQATPVSETQNASTAASARQSSDASAQQRAARDGFEPSTESLSEEQRSTRSSVHAGPAARLLGRELGVDLTKVTPTGPRGRVLKEDIQSYVKQALKTAQSGQSTAGSAASGATGAGIPPIPAVDFSQFGEIEEKPMGRLLKAGATNLHRSWLNVPHVTQFDEADVTEMEAFRRSVKEEAFREGAKLTPLPFMIKAVAYALKKFPQFNVSLHPEGDKLIWKKYVNIGIAVDTPDGLMVPVLRDADKKSVIEIAIEFADLAKRAQSKKLKREEMQGGCFTISSLGSIGGTAFTPIVNAPEVAILGISRSQMKPVWNGSEFKPRLMMPLSLSYDHRALNGADAARFTAYLATLLSDIRRLTL
ncbi:Dihydrolipoyllysine-residue acetyltransferase component of pyruvate dehydrogenase complex [Halomonadaceae bacterium LMG 33818]|uniref:dihydrolipoyllysine-residue acetyltransferase n=1 Tax=Cernens ardua TaxID=3402176 RepID=UPI003EDBBFC1